MLIEGLSEVLAKAPAIDGWTGLNAYRLYDIAARTGKTARSLARSLYRRPPSDAEVDVREGAEREPARESGCDRGCERAARAVHRRALDPRSGEPGERDTVRGSFREAVVRRALAVAALHEHGLRTELRQGMLAGRRIREHLVQRRLCANSHVVDLVLGAGSGKRRLRRAQHPPAAPDA